MDFLGLLTGAPIMFEALCSREKVAGNAKEERNVPRRMRMGCGYIMVYILYIIHYRSYPIVIYHFPKKSNSNICI